MERSSIVMLRNSTTTPKDDDNIIDVQFQKFDDALKLSGNTEQVKNGSGQLTPLFQMFTYADSLDYILMFFGTIAALVTGIAQPIQILLFTDVINAFNPLEPQPPDVMQKNTRVAAMNFLWLGIGTFFSSFIYVTLWTFTASRQVKRIRTTYVNSIISKEIGWFDVNEPMELASRVADATVTIQDGIGRKTGDAIDFTAMTIAGLAIAWIKGWELALVLMAFTPVITCAVFVSMKVIASATESSIDCYSKAGAIAEEALSSIRTVHMFNACAHFVGKYQGSLSNATKAGVKKGLAVGWGTGLMFFTVFATYGIGMYYGARKIANDRLDGHVCIGSGCYDGAKVLTVFFSFIMGAMALGQAGPSVQAIYSARAAAFDVFAVIQRPSLINPMSNEGEKLPTVRGDIEINNVSFAYPSRPDVRVCNNYSLSVKSGETVALVGPSGSGKSTIVSLLERFYDPLSGSVTLDGHDVRMLNVKWLRQQIGLVGQEPSLFATSILENIRYGMPSATDEQVYEAAKAANAYNFIIEFPGGFDTQVGERGTQLSGGQKQRIAIARAIIKNPAILLLDEATSALDTESEQIVQASLDHLVAESKRTTIIIAHRLSTIRYADRIAVHSDGSIVELGSHDELMALPKGHYKLLVEAQNRTAMEDYERKKKNFIRERNNSTILLRRSQSSSRLSRRSRTSRKSSVYSYNQMSIMEEESSIIVNDSDVQAFKESGLTSRIWKMTLPEWGYLVFGSLGAMINAATYPVWGIFLTKITMLFFKYHLTRDEMLDRAMHYSMACFFLGVLFAISNTVQQYGYSVASQRLVERIRMLAFTSMLHQEIGWFDLDENSTGSLVSKLASDSATLQAITSETLNRGLVNVTSLGIGLGVALYYSWQMTLLTLATLPALAVAMAIQAQQMSGTLSDRKNNDTSAMSDAGSLLSETITSIRTVASFGMESAMNSAYAEYIKMTKVSDAKWGVLGGLIFGFAQGVMFWNLAIMFYVGGIWVNDRVIQFDDLFMVIIVIMLSTFGIGMATQNMTDGRKAKSAAAQIFRLIDRVPAIDATSTEGVKPDHLIGDIEFKGLKFSYPARPDAEIYRNYSLKVNSGQTVALVGASGSGKSTAIALLERFYDPNSGMVTIDGRNIKDFSLPWLRERISLVSQEPVLFGGTIAENIALGKQGATREEIEEAAKKANAYDFICNFPNGFDTDVGDRGAQVSGGQKQRIAIARAILRDPVVLLLDEATSALDNESERVVQASLDNLLALKRRTTIIVAHRLSTIRNADLIAVTKNGEIVEINTHDELMKIENGVYKSLVARQVGTST